MVIRLMYLSVKNAIKRNADQAGWADGFKCRCSLAALPAILGFSGQTPTTQGRGEIVVSE